jgi:hypothetical protein
MAWEPGARGLRGRPVTADSERNLCEHRIFEPDPAGMLPFAKRPGRTTPAGWSTIGMFSAHDRPIDASSRTPCVSVLPSHPR